LRCTERWLTLKASAAHREESQASFFDLWSTEMSKLQRLSAGLVAATMLTTSALAHETSPAKRYVPRNHNACTPMADHWLFSHARMAAPSATKFNLLPQDQQPGGICDHGDNPGIC
jgi:hypothetical protein